MTILDSMPHLATAKSRARTADGVGGGRDTYTTVFTDRACWVQQAGDSEVTEYARRGIRISEKVYFTTNPELNELHTLTINGIEYDVISYPEIDASAGMGVVWRVMVNRTTEV